jgi:class 3 adenylate cyclase
VHVGPVISVTLNDRLDYFGTTVNHAARLESFSNGNDIVVTDEIMSDPETIKYITENKIKVEDFFAKLKGFEDREYKLWRISAIDKI